MNQSVIETLANDIKSVVEEIKEENPFTRILRDKTICWNTFSMLLIWCVSNVTYFLISYSLTTLGGDPFVSNYISDIAEIIANFNSLLIISIFGFKPTMIAAYFIGATGMLALNLIPADSSIILNYALILYSKLGAAATYNLSYIGNGILFDPSILSTTIGLCTASSRLANTATETISKIEPHSFGRWFFIGLTIIGAILILGLRMPKKDAEPDESVYQK